MRSKTYVSQQFLSLGFIKNQCADEYLVEMSHKDKADDFQRGRGRMKENEVGLEIFLIIAVCVFAVVLLGFCTYFILKRRGQLCKKRNDRGLRAISRFDSTEFNSVSINSTAKKNRKNRRDDLQMVPEDSYMDETQVTNNAIDARTLSRI